jgi:hypothetical protein
MPIPFICPHCGAHTEVAEQYAGQTGPCMRCGKSITVPPLSGTPGYTGSTKGSQVPLVVLLIVGALGLMVFFCGGLMFWSFRSVAVRGVGPMPTPRVSATKQTAAALDPDALCVDRLKRIGRAMAAYHEAHGSFPPAYLADEDGNPMHSWRVLLLPYLDCQELYVQYDFDEPWDGPSNRQLATAMPEVYRCPADDGDGPNDTSYVMVVGPGTLSDGTSTTSLSDIKDGAAGTLLVVETTASGIDWLEPADLSTGRMSFRVDDGSAMGIRSNHPSGCYGLVADGTVVMLRNEQSETLIRGMTTIVGGEDLEDEALTPMPE